jgi:hypothetical protein
MADAHFAWSRLADVYLFQAEDFRTTCLVKANCLRHKNLPVGISRLKYQV